MNQFERRAEIVRRFGSQRGAAKALRLTECDLSNLLNGHRAPRRAECIKLANAFGVEFVLELRERAEQERRQSGVSVAVE